MRGVGLLDWRTRFVQSGIEMQSHRLSPVVAEDFMHATWNTSVSQTRCFASTCRITPTNSEKIPTVVIGRCSDA